MAQHIFLLTVAHSKKGRVMEQGNGIGIIFPFQSKAIKFDPSLDLTALDIVPCLIGLRGDVSDSFAFIFFHC